MRYYAIHLCVSCSSGGSMGGCQSWSVLPDRVGGTCSGLTRTCSGRCLVPLEMLVRVLPPRHLHVRRVHVAQVDA